MTQPTNDVPDPLPHAGNLFSELCSDVAMRFYTLYGDRLGVARDELVGVLRVNFEQFYHKAQAYDRSRITALPADREKILPLPLIEPQQFTAFFNVLERRFCGEGMDMKLYACAVLAALEVGLLDPEARHSMLTLASGRSIEMLGGK